MNEPGRSTRLPPISTFAPCATATSTCFSRSTSADSVDKRAHRRLLVHGIAGLQPGERRLKLVEELVGDLVDDDEPLRGAAGLPRVVHAPPERPFDGMVEIGVLEHDERVAAAELHRGRLEVLSGPSRDAAAGRDAAGQRHALDARVVDDAVGLIVRDQQVGVEADGRAGVDPELLEGDGALRNASGVLHQQRCCRPSDADPRRARADNRESSTARRRR